MHEQMSWVSLPVARGARGAFIPEAKGHELPLLTPEAVAELQGTLLPHDVMGFLLDGKLPCRAEAGDDTSLLTSPSFLSARLEDDTAAKKIPRVLTLSEGVGWANKLALVLPASLLDLNPPQVAPTVGKPRKRQCQIDRLEVQKIGKALWAANGDLTQTDILTSAELLPYLKKYDDAKTVRGWLSKVDPRPPEKRRGRPPGRS